MFARVLLGCLALGALAVPAFADEPKVTAFKPVLMLRGSHTGIKAEQFAVVTSELGWEILWEAHRGDAKTQQFTETYQRLNIDFGTHYVVAVYTGGDSELFVTTAARVNTVLIRFEAHGRQTEGGVPGLRGPNNVVFVIADLVKKPTAYQVAKADAVADYCFVVLPKPVKTIIIEKDVRRQLPDPPLWQEQQRFPAPKDKK